LKSVFLQGAEVLSQQNRKAIEKGQCYRTLFLAGTLLVAGCNSGVDLANVTGKVTDGGKPRPDAVVTFTPTDGRRMSLGRTDESGLYQMIYTVEKNGALTGHQRVTIADVKKPTEALLTKEVDVGSGSNTFDFDLSEANASKKK
jgi:hypothetical protein